VNPPNYSHRKSRPDQEYQRSIYLPVMRTNTTNLDRIRTHFDFVNPAQIAGERSQTVVPTQALFVMNNELFRQRAKALADSFVVPPSGGNGSASSLPPEGGPSSQLTDTRLEQLWLRVFNRPITDSERTASTTFLAELDATITEQKPAEKESLKWQELCHSLLASNEFLFRL
jgi:hypothetical protein